MRIMSGIDKSMIGDVVLDRTTVNNYTRHLVSSLNSAERKRKMEIPLEPNEFMAVLCGFVAECQGIPFNSAVEEVSRRLLK